MKILSCYDKILGFSKVLTLNAFSKQVVFPKKKMTNIFRKFSRNKILRLLLKMFQGRNQRKIVTEAISDKKNTVPLFFNL